MAKFKKEEVFILRKQFLSGRYDLDKVEDQNQVWELLKDLTEDNYEVLEFISKEKISIYKAVSRFETYQYMVAVTHEDSEETLFIEDEKGLLCVIEVVLPEIEKGEEFDKYDLEDEEEKNSRSKRKGEKEKREVVEEEEDEEDEEEEYKTAVKNTKKKNGKRIDRSKVAL